MYIKVKVKAGAGEEEIKKISDEKFEIKVKEKAERNQANQRVLEMMAGYFEIPLNKIKIISGHHWSNKILEII